MPNTEYRFPMAIPFGKERLDALDRKLLETICNYGRDGQSFNKLVEEVKSSASRSTFAFRAKRLERLGYIESFGDPQHKQLKRIRGKPLMLMITRVVVRLRNQCQELDTVLTSAKATDNLSTEEEGFARIKQILEDVSQKMKGIFSLVPTYALYLGEAAASDLILPMVMDDFKRLNSNLASFVSSDSRIRDALMKEKIGPMAVESLKDDFKYAFGTEMGTALPRFSKRMQVLAEKGPK